MKFRDWLRGTVRPVALTLSEWPQWENYAKTLHPFRYWLAEEALDVLHDIVTSPITVYDRVAYKIRNIRAKSHILYTPNFKLGQYADFGTKLFECSMNGLVDFVEVELAWLGCSNKKKFKRGRSKEEGLAYIRWYLSLEKEVENVEWIKTLLEVYTWYTVYRPMRPDLYDFYGSDYGMIVEKENEYELEDAEMFVKLISIRRHLWT